MLLPQRFARVQIVWLAFIASVGCFLALAAFLYVGSRPFAPAASRPLVVFCAAGLREPIQKITDEYQAAFGVEVQLQFGGSNSQLAALEVSQRADIFIPADDAYIQTAKERGLIGEVLPLASMSPVLVVKKGNPLQVKSLGEISTKRLRISHANPEAAAIGKISRDALQEAKLWSAYEKQIVVTKPTVNDVATDIQVGTVDAGIVWDVTAKMLSQDLQIVPVPEFDNVKASVAACIVATSSEPTAALHLSRYMAARDKGLPVFANAGFGVGEGDEWDERPELHLYAGSMLKPALEATLTEFEQREGVQVTRIYNGCGILVGQMAIKRPDAFFACDKEFFEVDLTGSKALKVKDIFAEQTMISGNQLVMLVKKGNPHKIRRLRDLAKPGLRVGIGHEKQCAMGVLTQQTLREDKSDKAVMKNVTVQTPTGDMLVNQMRTGSLDVAIAYISNAAGTEDILEPLVIDIPCAFAEQPFAIGKESKHKQLASRLLNAIRTQQSRERFLAFGFTWKDSSSGAKPK
jgi:molybdenum ABC transporter molybdate-binding protein